MAEIPSYVNVISLVIAIRLNKYRGKWQATPVLIMLDYDNILELEIRYLKLSNYGVFSNYRKDSSYLCYNHY